MEDQELGGEVGTKGIDTKYYELQVCALAQENDTLLVQPSSVVYTAKRPHLYRQFLFCTKEKNEPLLDLLIVLDEFIVLGRYNFGWACV